MENERATAFEFLEWFYENADFGPADEDVREFMKRNFKKKTGKEIPEEYDDE